MFFFCYYLMRTFIEKNSVGVQSSNKINFFLFRKNKIEMFYSNLHIFIVIALITVYSHSFPTGAPLRHCGDMTPGHNVEPLDDEPPFQILIEKSNISSSLNIRIKADDEYHFKGFLIEARTNLNTQEAIGTWSTSERHTKLLDCFNNTRSAVTHYFRDDDSSNLIKSEDGPHFTDIHLKWSHPNFFQFDQVYFVATIVKKFKQIYKNVTAQINPNKQLSIDESLEIRLRKLFMVNFRLEYVHFTFVFLLIFIFFLSLILLHILSVRNKKKKYVLLSNQKNIG